MDGKVMDREGDGPPLRLLQCANCSGPWHACGSPWELNGCDTYRPFPAISGKIFLGSSQRGPQRGGREGTSPLYYSPLFSSPLLSSPLLSPRLPCFPRTRVALSQGPCLQMLPPLPTSRPLAGNQRASQGSRCGVYPGTGAAVTGAKRQAEPPTLCMRAHARSK